MVISQRMPGITQAYRSRSVVISRGSITSMHLPFIMMMKVAEVELAATAAVAAAAAAALTAAASGVRASSL